MTLLDQQVAEVDGAGESPARPAPRAVEVAGRLIVAGLSAAMGIIHLRLWEIGVRHIHIIGPLFLVNLVGGLILALAVLAVPRRGLAVVAVAAAAFLAGTLVALFISIGWGLFGFHAEWQAPFIASALAVESAGVVAGGTLSALSFRLLPARLRSAVGRS